MSLEEMAKYPFTKEAREYIAKKKINIKDLKPDDLAVKRAEERIKEALLSGMVYPKSDFDTEIVSFYIAAILAKATNQEHIYKRWAYAEANKVQRHLEQEKGVHRVAALFQAFTGVVIEKA